MVQGTGAYKVYVTDQPDETKKIKAITPELHTQLVPLSEDFGRKLEARGHALADQNKATIEKDDTLKVVTTVNQHFIMVLNFGIVRGKFHPSVRADYGLDATQETLPPMSREAEAIDWAHKLINGETHRIAGGGAPMLDPSLAELQAAFNAYSLKHDEQLRKKADYDAAQEEVEAMRPDVDKFIKKLWNQIEFYFSDDEPSSLRRKARGWGVVYATRPDEEPEPQPETFTGIVKANTQVMIMHNGFDVNTMFIAKNPGPVPVDLYTAASATDPPPATRVRIEPGIQKEVWASELGADSNTYLMVFNADTTTDGSWEVTVGNPE
jgi:hypothetical protein